MLETTSIDLSTTAVVLASEFPSHHDKTDIRRFIEYLIEHHRLGFVLCATEHASSSDVLENTKIRRIRTSVLHGMRLAELWLAGLFLKEILANRARIANVYIYYFSGAIIVALGAATVGIRVWIDFKSVPVKSLVLGKILRTLCAYVAHRCVFISPAIETSMFFGNPHIQRRTLPLGVDLTQMVSLAADGRSMRVLAERYGLRPCIRFVYLGILDRSRQLEDVLDAFLELAKEQESAQLLFIGGGPYLSTLKSRVDGSLSKFVVFTGPLEFEEAITLTACCHVGITYYPIRRYNVQPALKTLEYLSLGLPVIAVDTLGNRSYISHGANGWLIKDSKWSLHQTMKSILTNPDALERAHRYTKSVVASHDYTDIFSRSIPGIFA